MDLFAQHRKTLSLTKQIKLKEHDIPGIADRATWQMFHPSSALKTQASVVWEFHISCILSNLNNPNKERNLSKVLPSTQRKPESIQNTHHPLLCP